MDKRQFLTAAAVLAATPALGQAQAKKPGTDDLGRTAQNMRAKVIPRRKARTTKLFLTPPSWAQRHHRRSAGTRLLGAAAAS